jgi:hypothetical protein
MNCLHLKFGSSKSVHLESGSSKLVHQKSGSLKSVHWKWCLGDVQLPKIKFAAMRARPADVAPAVQKWRYFILMYLYKSVYLHNNFLSGVCAAKF